PAEAFFRKAVITSERWGPCRATGLAAPTLRPGFFCRASGAWSFSAAIPGLAPWAAFLRPFGAVSELAFAAGIVQRESLLSTAVEVPPCFASVGRPRGPSPHGPGTRSAADGSLEPWAELADPAWNAKLASFWSPSAGKRT